MQSKLSAETFSPNYHNQINETLCKYNFPKFPHTFINEKRIVFQLCPQSYLYGEKDSELSDDFMEEYFNKEEEQNKNSSLSQKRGRAKSCSFTKNNKKKLSDIKSNETNEFHEIKLEEEIENKNQINLKVNNN